MTRKVTVTPDQINGLFSETNFDADLPFNEGLNEEIIFNFFRAAIKNTVAALF
jgi:hypothetical protein